MKNQLLIGEYMLGYRNVALYGKTDGVLGGHFRLSPEKGVAEIHVSLDYEWWHEVLNVLLHEAMEFVFCELQGRFQHNPWFGLDHAQYLFSFDHAVFAESCARAAFFIAKCQRDLATAHRKHRAKKKKT